MKKKLLFVIPSLVSGGAEKSLTTLLQLLPPEEYDVDLFLFRREGLFLSLVPEWVHISDAGEAYRMFDGPILPALRYFCKRGKWLTALRRIRYAVLQKLPVDRAAGGIWRCLSALLPQLSGYDTVIGYLEGTATYFAVDHVKADKVISFLHTDYDRICNYKRLDAVYYAKLDTLVSVSEECCAKAIAYFPFLRDRIACMYNITSPTLVRKMALDEASFPPESSVLTLLTVGRLSEPKGPDLAVQACAKLRETGLDFRWYHIGVGPMESALKEMAKQLGVQDRYVFLGEKSNPYPYIRACDIFVQPSRFEGKSIAVDEAKCLAKPIVVTDFDTVFDQITDGVTGIITQKTPQSIADGILRLTGSPALRETLSRNLQAEKVGTEEEVEKFLALI